MWTHKDIGKYLITKLLALKNSRYQIDNMFWKIWYNLHFS
jgi:hypothetical protein